MTGAPNTLAISGCDGIAWPTPEGIDDRRAS